MAQNGRRHRRGGGLRICGCRWRVASDDFVFPSWIEFFTRLIFLSILVGVLVYAEISKLSSCASEHHLHIYLIVAIVLFAINLANNLAMALDSARGSIWDENALARRWVVPLVYLNIFLTIGEFAWAFVGSFWVVRGLVTECLKPEPVMTLSDIPLLAVLVVVVATWVGLAFKAFLYLLTFNSIDCERNANNEHFVMDKPQSFVSRMLSLCMKETQLDLFKDIAHILSDTFDDASFVPTDIAAALLLLFVQQEQEDEAIVVQHENELHKIREREEGEGLRQDDDEEWKSLDRMKYFMSYAGASYGYTWFLMSNTRINFWKLYPHLGCCVCCCSCVHDQGEYIEADNCIGCNTAALRAMLPHLDSESIVYISYRNKFLEVPFFVAIDHKYKSIVVSIRGTLSLEDALTDLCAKPESLGVFDERLNDYFAHSGIVKAANYVYKELGDKNLLNKAFSYYDDYQLVVTGHSLGAGTAVVLTFMLRLAYPNTKCYAYSPPGGLLNEAAAKISQDFTISVLMGHDLVPRLSLQALGHLKQNMKDVLKRCQLPKYQILAGICSCCISDWKSHVMEHGPSPSRLTSVVSHNGAPISPSKTIVSRGESETSDDSNRPILNSSGKNEERQTVKYESFDEISSIETGTGDLPSRRSSLSRMKMVLPGTVWHVEPIKPDGSEAFGACREDKDVEWKVREKTCDDFQEIVVSPKMMRDHFPNHVQANLSTVKSITRRRKHQE